MSTLSPAMHWTIIYVDVEGFGNLDRTHQDQGAVRVGLYQALNQAFARSEVCWDDCEYEDRGDGVLILVPPKVPKTHLATDVPRELAAALHAHNQAPAAAVAAAGEAPTAPADRHAWPGRRVALFLMLTALADAAAPGATYLARQSGISPRLTGRPGPSSRQATGKLHFGSRPVTLGAGSSGFDVITFSPDGKTLASTGSTDHAIRLWDIARRERIGAPLTGHTVGVPALAFSPNGQMLASGANADVSYPTGTDHTIRLWDVATRRTTAILPGHVGGVYAVAFSPGGQVLASGGSDAPPPCGSRPLWGVGGWRVGAPVG